MNPSEILKAWVAAINNHDVRALTALMAPDHVFVDSLGNRVNGARSMEAGWHSYFTMSRLLDPRGSCNDGRRHDAACRGGGRDD